MRALRFHGGGDVRLDELPDAPLGPNEVRIAVAACGICGSDMHEFRHGPAAIPTSDRPHPLTGTSLPVVLGHEFAGTVVEVGADVSEWHTGNRVAIEPLLRDHDCEQCRRGRYNLCRAIGFLGLSGNEGGFAERAVVPASALHRLPDTVSLEHGALVEPLAVGWHAIDQGQVEPSDDVLIIGGGPVGLAVLLCLKHRGAGRVIVSEPSPQRRSAATAMGAGLVIDPNDSDVARTVRRETNGGVRVAFDCAGQAAATPTAVSALRPGGRLVLVALQGAAVQLPAARMLALELSVVGSMAYANTYPQVIAALAAGLSPTPLVTRRAPLAAAPVVFDELARDERQELKVLISP
jgi:(R,R)-butanediol dehydrogenase/meso-butanediol dehydrogenase/diacetyl reductase